MSFLLDTNICSEHLKRPSGLVHRFIQHSGRLHISTVVLGELYAGLIVAKSQNVSFVRSNRNCSPI